MIFKRRDRKSVLQAMSDLVYPKGGWGRAFQYVKYRLRRLPGSPETIARGVWAGVFTTFTPFYGLHFFVAAIVGRAIKGNILAALMSTFFGNPLTYLPIGVVSLKTGHFLLGTEFQEGDSNTLLKKFANAGKDLWHNFKALFTDAQSDWSALSVFYDEVFFPYLVGGILPGIVAASVCYYISLPLIRTYQKRRTDKMRAKLDALTKRAIQQGGQEPGES